jgi:hypothetical protein
VLKRAWSTTLNLFGWSWQKAIGGAVVLVSAFLFGGVTAGFNLVTGSTSLLAGLVIVGPMVFVWGIFQTQHEMYLELFREMIAASNKQASGGREGRKRPPANFDKWRHVPKMDLTTAAQLWTGEQPGMGMFGEVKETYAMLSGGIQSGEIEIEGDPTIDPRVRNADLQQKRLNPSPNLIVTRAALRAFAKLHKYDPEFLRDA